MTSLTIEGTVQNKVTAVFFRIKCYTILKCHSRGHICRSSSNTGVSCDVTGVAGVW